MDVNFPIITFSPSPNRLLFNHDAEPVAAMARLSHRHIIFRFFLRNLLPRPPPALLLIRRPEITTTSAIGECCFSSSSSSYDITDLRERILLLTEKPSIIRHDGELDEIRSQMSSLADELLTAGHLSNLEDDDDLTDLAAFLDSHLAVSLIRRSPSGLAFVELLLRLKTRPRLAVQVNDLIYRVYGLAFSGLIIELIPFG